MNEESKRLQEKLRAKVAKTLALSEKAKDVPLIAFARSADLLPGSEDLVDRVVASLEASGRKVGVVRQDPKHPDEKDLDELLAALGKDFDIVVCEGFGFKPIPKILVTKRVEEGLNLGLTQIVGYVADKDARALIPRFAPEDADGIARFIEKEIIGGGTNG